MEDGMPSLTCETCDEPEFRLNSSLTNVKPQLFVVIVLLIVTVQSLGLQSLWATTGLGSWVDNSANSRSESTSTFICRDHCAPCDFG